jgi:hypothetical protein
VELATRHGTDTWGRHWYARRYESHFAPRRHDPVTLLEIGVGGYKDPARGGELLRMWRDYFTEARIFGIGIHDTLNVESVHFDNVAPAWLVGQ